MYKFIKTALLTAALCFSSMSVAHKECPCFTATSYVSSEDCSAFTKACVIPECIIESITTIPGPAKACPTTPTITSLLPCKTACQIGCAVFTTTATASTSCLSSKTSCYTETRTLSDYCPIATLQCVEPACIVLSTKTVPPINTACPTTPTVTSYVPCQTTCNEACKTAYTTVTAAAYKV
ncbi:uncharacterized protein K441DRAFT_666290 [Cenococcum geophilum 1.58]|uniref:uncharacterized protein n=1 Tax=Cenococcum geophilum 1.58 TaxID=794803 RepID=UPI00358EBDE2|nr:hypothetical protein K441DRAFT_666290 [Cenococcum geophilum 1.58]